MRNSLEQGQSYTLLQGKFPLELAYLVIGLQPAHKLINEHRPCLALTSAVTVVIL